MRPNSFHLLFMPLLLASTFDAMSHDRQPQAASEVSYVGASYSTLRLEVDRRQYLVDVARATVRPANAGVPATMFYSRFPPAGLWTNTPSSRAPRSGSAPERMPRFSTIPVFLGSI
jgi:hypothetical protein